MLDHLIVAAKQRISRGEVPKRTQQTVGPLEFLKNVRDRMGGESERKKKSLKVSAEDDDASMGSEGEEEEDTDLEDEKMEDVEGASGEGGAKKKSKKK